MTDIVAWLYYCIFIWLHGSYIHKHYIGGICGRLYIPIIYLFKLYTYFLSIYPSSVAYWVCVVLVIFSWTPNQSFHIFLCLFHLVTTNIPKLVWFIWLPVVISYFPMWVPVHPFQQRFPFLTSICIGTTVI